MHTFCLRAQARSAVCELTFERSPFCVSVLTCLCNNETDIITAGDNNNNDDDDDDNNGQAEDNRKNNNDNIDDTCSHRKKRSACHAVLNPEVQ